MKEIEKMKLEYTNLKQETINLAEEKANIV